MSNIKKSLLILLAACIAAGSAAARAQQMFSGNVRPAHIGGTVMDTNGGVIPDATVVLDAPDEFHRTVTANDNGLFQFDDLKPGIPYNVTVSAKGFGDWKSPAMVLEPSQFAILSDVKLKIETEATSVVVVAGREDIAVEQVKFEEQQRVLGFIPNFYVSYDRNAAPLPARLKFQLALKVSVDPVTFAGTSFLAGMNQAAHYPDYVEGVKGYGQRFGAIYANDLTDIMVGGAILPSILHEDPRYFYQGTGTTKSRLLHALSSPLICRRDNGSWGPNYSSLGGYLASGAIANAYYPQANRGGRLVVNTFSVDFGANVANGILQEFVLRRFTPSVRNRE